LSIFCVKSVAFKDITVFRNFVTETQRRQCLFITVEREQPLERPQNRYFDPNPVIPVEEPEQKEEERPTENVEKELERELLEADKQPLVEKKPRSEFFSL
jgi:hypothetical protein